MKLLQTLEINKSLGDGCRLCLHQAEATEDVCRSVDKLRSLTSPLSSGAPPPPEFSTLIRKHIESVAGRFWMSRKLSIYGQCSVVTSSPLSYRRAAGRLPNSRFPTNPGVKCCDVLLVNCCPLSRKRCLI